MCQWFENFSPPLRIGMHYGFTFREVRRKFFFWVFYFLSVKRIACVSVLLESELWAGKKDYTIPMLSEQMRCHYP